jgi:hypothetical protein
MGVRLHLLAIEASSLMGGRLKLRLIAKILVFVSLGLACEDQKDTRDMADAEAIRQQILQDQDAAEPVQVGGRFYGAVI